MNNKGNAQGDNYRRGRKHIRIRVAGMLMNGKKEVLLVNHMKKGRSYWLFPGGGVEYGETMETALKREFREELSIELTAVKNLFIVHDTIYPDKKRHIINFYFVVKAKKPLKFNTNPDKVLKRAEWADIKKFRRFLFYPDVKNVIITHWKSGFRKTLGFIKVKWKK